MPTITQPLVKDTWVEWAVGPVQGIVQAATVGSVQTTVDDAGLTKAASENGLRMNSDITVDVPVGKSLYSKCTNSGSSVSLTTD